MHITKIHLIKTIAFLLCLSFFFSALYQPAAATETTQGTCTVKLKVKQDYEKAFQVLTLINKERENAGLRPLVMDKSLIKSAMTRAAESSLYWDHTRPDGSDCFSVSEIVDGENLGVNAFSAQYIMELWMNSKSHRSNILDSDWVAVGVGCIRVDGTYYWVQSFSSVKTKAVKARSYRNNTATYSITVSTAKKYYRPHITISSKKLKKGKKAKITTYWDNTYNNILIPAGNLRYSSSNKKVCTVSANGIVNARKPGTATIKVWFPGNKNKTKTFKINVKS